LKETQTKFYALDLHSFSDDAFSTNDAYNLMQLPVKEAAADGTLQYIASTYDPEDQALLEGYYEGKNRKVITFAGVLQHDIFPLAKIVDYMLKLGQEEMGRPIEIEFAVNIEKKEKAVRASFYLLQIRPIVDEKEKMNDDLHRIPLSDTLIFSNHALGHGTYTAVQDIIYVKTAAFNASFNPKIAEEVERLNQAMVEAERHYVLVGPGRWGSSDPWLGIPVKWPHISQAQVIVESGLENYRIEPSQGTHFFQNLTSFGVGYFTINPYMNDGVLDEALLNSLSAVQETAHLRQVHFDQPLTIKINGKKNIGVVMV
jgi:hypothetical protein